MSISSLPSSPQLKLKRSFSPFRAKSPSSPLNIREGEVAVVTYTSAMDKMKIFSAFIREGIENGDLVNYTYRDDELQTVRIKLKEHGIDVQKYERKGVLLLRSLTEFYKPDGIFDKDRAIKKELGERAEAKRILLTYLS